MRILSVRLIGATILLCLSISGVSQLSSTPAYQIPDPNPELSNKLEYFEYLLDELDHRRRLQFLFPNIQNLTDGIPIGYVQTSTGNLTFERRDLVVLGIESLIASRVYDSRDLEGIGFGPGWRLTLIESIRLQDNHVVYTSGNGSRQSFYPIGAGRFSPSEGSQILSDSSLVIAGSSAVIVRADGSVLEFRKLAGTEELALVRSTSGAGVEVTYSYNGNQLLEIVQYGKSVLRLAWMGDRVTRISDASGREVHYGYDSLDRLVQVTDIGGQSWTYTYDGLNRIVAAAYPDGETYLELNYDENGRVSRSLSVREFTYDYFEDVTTVSEVTGDRHVFKRTETGATVGYSNSLGIEWHIVLDSRSRPIKMVKSGVVFGFTYEGSRLATIEHSGGFQRFHYDEAERFTHVTGNPVAGSKPKRASYNTLGETVVTDSGRRIQFSHDESGRLSVLEENDRVYHLAYDDNGFIDRISRGPAKVAFMRDHQGRIASVRYPDGTASRYSYDVIGNRDKVEFSNGASMTLKHDGRGNIVKVLDKTVTGIEFEQSYAIDRHNRIVRVRFPGSTELSVAYDGLGRPSHFNMAGQTVYVDYEVTGVPVQIRSAEEKRTLVAKRSESVFQPSRPMHRVFMHNEQRSPRVMRYGPVAISLDSMDVGITPIAYDAIPGYAMADSALFISKFWLKESNPSKVEKPSNPVFQPPEYESTNCCMQCPWTSTCGWLCTTFIGTSPELENTCICSPVYNGPSCAPGIQWAKNAARQTVVSALLDIPYGPREEGLSVDCPHLDQIARPVQGKEYHICLDIPVSPSNTVYVGHTHPLFMDSDVGETIYCGEDSLGKLISVDHVVDTNRDNEKCTDTDKAIATEYPLLMRGPSGSITDC